MKTTNKIKPKTMPQKHQYKQQMYEDQQMMMPQEQNMQGQQGQGQDENMDFQNEVNEKSIAMELLREGYIQSYIDFFKIAKPEEAEMDSLESQYGGRVKRQSMKMLQQLKYDLCSAEERQRYNNIDKSEAFKLYYKKAEEFYELKEYDNAAYFYQRVIHLAKNERDDEYEVKGKLGLGKCCDLMDNPREAIDILEKSLQVSESRNQDDLVIKIAQKLIEIYKKRAESQEKGQNENTNGALQDYEKCLEVAQKLRGESDTQKADISHKIGLLYYKNGEYEKAKEYQKDYLDIISKDAQIHSKTQRTMDAYAALAKCYIKLKQQTEAEEYLQKYYKQSSGNRNAKSDAALHLANLYAQKGQIEKSNQYYKEHFKEAKDEKAEAKDRKLVDRARVTVGIALANTNINSFIEKVKNSDKNLKELLDAKCKKSDTK